MTAWRLARVSVISSWLVAGTGPVAGCGCDRPVSQDDDAGGAGADGGPRDGSMTGDGGTAGVDASPRGDGGQPAGCTACHGAPPDTPGHRTHGPGAPTVYGGLATAESAGVVDGYAFGCGHCHPRDGAKHKDGLTQVELHDPDAPAGSWKARSPATARYQPGPDTLRDERGLAYTRGTCRDTACHAGLTTLAPSVPEPGVDFPFTGYPIVYPEYAVTRAPFYREATWGGTLGCNGCHDYPPRSDEPGAVGGAGSTHASIDATGRENLHIYNHSFDNEPVPCRACHADTVSDKGAWTRDLNDIATLADIPVSGTAFHANGRTDVRLKDDEVVDLYGQVYSLAGATYEPVSRTCSNVSCHLLQTTVTWGQPYRWNNPHECNNCHRR